MRWSAFLIVVVMAVVASSCTSAPQPGYAPPPSTTSGRIALDGLVAYSLDGDIYVGDLETGIAEPIITGPQKHTNPMFSPDGGHIAVVRGDPYRDPSIVVVRADGSDERVVLPSGLAPGGVGPFAWTPDGASILVQHSSHIGTPKVGQLSLLDPAGESEPRLLTPPLPASIGAIYFNTNAQVAPMFRPPQGDLILSSSGWNTFEAFDSDLASSTPLALDALEPYEPYLLGDPTWSPDGSMIVFSLDLYAERRPGADYLGRDLFVVNADGTDLRRIGVAGRDPLWSPDGSSIAYQQVAADETQPTNLVIFNLESGAESILEVATAQPKHSTEYHTITWNTYHTWYYEAWSWAPDGQHLLVLERHGNRPYVVDLRTETITELPWIADSAPSWSMRSE